VPKINVYLPDDLATAVRESGIPVSPICQKALAEAVQKVGRAKLVIDLLRDANFDPDGEPRIAARMMDLMTPRIKEVIRLARQLSGARTAETKDLLIGVIDEGHNLGLQLLQSLDVDTDALRDAAARVAVTESAPSNLLPSEDTLWSAISLQARFAIASAFDTAIGLGHNYLGCEHLLIGLIGVEDGVASVVLREFGVEAGGLRRALTSAIAGVVHGRHMSKTDDSERIEDILRRLEALESRLSQ
jgi:Clp amino terminal domain, pathogenicity island component